MWQPAWPIAASSMTRPGVYVCESVCVREREGGREREREREGEFGANYTVKAQLYRLKWLSMVCISKLFYFPLSHLNCTHTHTHTHTCTLATVCSA